MEVVFFVLFLICAISAAYYLFFENENFKEKIIKRFSLFYFNPYLLKNDDALKNMDRSEELVDYINKHKPDFVYLINIEDQEAMLYLYQILMKNYKYGKILENDLFFSKYPIKNVRKLSEKNNSLTLKIQDKKINIVLLNERQKLLPLQGYLEDYDYIFTLTHYNDKVSNIIKNTESLVPTYDFGLNELNEDFMGFDKNKIIQVDNIRQMILVHKLSKPITDYSISEEYINGDIYFNFKKVISKNKRGLVYDKESEYQTDYISPFPMMKLKVLF